MTGLQPYSQRYREHLLQNILPFWMEHGLDREYGGLFTGLDRDGKRYDSRKYVWMNGRAVWTFARLHRTLQPLDAYREVSLSCLNFLRKHAYAADGTIHFSLTREGAPAFQQRKPYSAVFVALGLIEAGRAFGIEQYLQEGVALFWKVRRWVDHPEELGRPASSMSQLADIMVIALLALELYEVTGEARYADELAWCLRRVWLHLDPDRGILRDNALVDADTPEDRFFCAGSAAEVGWFLLHVLERIPDAKTEAMLLDAIDRSLHFGWDNEFGGLYYFQDVDDRPMLQLESNMKLWWPHTEAIYAAILAYTKTRDAKWLAWLEKLDQYTFATFPDPQGKEWFGYCDRRNTPTSTLKGNNYKGVFHVPRFLLFSMQRIDGANVTI